MDEREWLACDDLETLWRAYPWAQASERKVRLFVSACCRLVWPQLKDERSRGAVEVLEGAAEGPEHIPTLEAADASSGAAMREAMRAIDPVKWKVEWAGTQPERMQWAETEGVCLVAQAEAAYAAAEVVVAAINTPQVRLGNWVNGESLFCWVERATRQAAAATTVFGPERERVSRQAGVAARQQVCSLFRDIFGNPFCPVALDPLWQTPTVTALARETYDLRRFEDLPILADALEEAGCADAEILGHLRGSGPHARGCWCVDLILDRK